MVNTVSVSDGGQAIVGNITQNTVDKGKADATKSPRLVTDRSGIKMPIIEPDEQSATTVPRIEQNQHSVQPRQGASAAHDKRSQAQRRTHALQYTLWRSDPLRRILSIARR